MGEEELIKHGLSAASFGLAPKAVKSRRSKGLMRFICLVALLKGVLDLNFVFSCFSVPRLSEKASKKKKNVSKEPLKSADAPPSSTGALEGTFMVDLTEEVSELPITGASSEPLVTGSIDVAPSLSEGEQATEGVLVRIRPKRKVEDLSLGTLSVSKKKGVFVEPQQEDLGIEAEMVSYEFPHLGLGLVEVWGCSATHPAFQVCLGCLELYISWLSMLTVLLARLLSISTIWWKECIKPLGGRFI